MPRLDAERVQARQFIKLRAKLKKRKDVRFDYSFFFKDKII